MNVYLARHFLIETQSVEENSTKHLSNKLSAEGDEGIVNQVCTTMCNGS